MAKKLIVWSVWSLIALYSASAQNTESECAALRAQMDNDRVLLIALDSAVTKLKFELVRADERYVASENQARQALHQVALLQAERTRQRRRFVQWVAIGAGSGILAGIVIGVLIAK